MGRAHWGATIRFRARRRVASWRCSDRRRHRGDAPDRAGHNRGRRKNGIAVHGRDRCGDLRRNGRGGGGMVKFSTNVDDPATRGSPAGKSVDTVEAALEGPAEIVDESLAEMETISERRPRYLCRASVNGFEMRGIVTSTAEEREVRREFHLKGVVETTCFGFGSRVLEAITRLADQA